MREAVFALLILNQISTLIERILRDFVRLEPEARDASISMIGRANPQTYREIGEERAKAPNAPLD